MCVKLWSWSQFFFQNKLDIIPALTDANLALRHEKEKLDKDLDQVREQLKELDPLREKLKKVEEKEEKSEQLIKTLKLEAEQNETFWQEELEKMKIEFGKQIADLQKTIEQQAEQVRLTFLL